MTDAGTMELVDLEALFAEFVPCESKHLDSNDNHYGPCLKVATHQWLTSHPDDRTPLNVCTRVAEYVEMILAEARLICADCGHPIVECFSIRPL